MVLTEKQSADMLEAAKPLLRWLNENCHPHCTVIVTPTEAELLEGVCMQRTEEFVKD